MQRSLMSPQSRKLSDPGVHDSCGRLLSKLAEERCQRARPGLDRHFEACKQSQTNNMPAYRASSDAVLPVAALRGQFCDFA